MARSRHRAASTDTDQSADVITTTADLDALVEQLSGAEFLAVDTEFMREQTYYSQLCLVQISDGTHHAAIDPLAPDIDLGRLWTLLADPQSTKVFHAAHQDLEIFLKEMGSPARCRCSTRRLPAWCSVTVTRSDMTGWSAPFSNAT
jgi:ribonuclease D